MDKEKIIGFLTSGVVPSDNENKAFLQDIVRTFPYFQLAQVLYAKQLYDDNDTGVAARVKLASAYAPNRRAMYLLFRKQRDTAISVPARESKTFVKPVATEEQKYNFVFRPAEPPVVKETPKPGAFIVSLPKTEEIKKEQEEEKESTASPVSETFLEKEILSNIAVTQTEQEITEIPPSVEENMEVSAPEPLPIAAGTVPEAISQPEPQPDINSKHSFEEWLRIVPGVKSADSGKAKAAPAKSIDVIDRFLANEPRISKPKAEFFSPAKAAKMSVSEDESLVSETLAGIYLAQGNLHRALKAYESLLLQNPEKSTYFAARIEEIRRKLESQKNK